MLKRCGVLPVAVIAVMLLCRGETFAQGPNGGGIINATLNNRNAIALVFDSDAGGVTLAATGSSAATLNFGTISAFGPLSSGVVRTAVTVNSFTVRTTFDVKVVKGGLASRTYRLSANLASSAPAGLAYTVDGVTLTSTAQTVQANARYGRDIAHILDLAVSTAAPNSGGPAIGTSLTTTINFTATAN